VKSVIFGGFGQDGALLSRFLLEKGHVVYLGSRLGDSKEERVRVYLRDLSAKYPSRIHKLKINLLDQSNLETLLSEILPDQVFNFAAESNVKKSWDNPEEYIRNNYQSAQNLFASIIRTNQNPKVIQMLSSEIFGEQDGPQDEETPSRPSSPYGESKAMIREITERLRKEGNCWVTSVIPFNHESYLRSEDYFSRKLSKAVVAIRSGSQSFLEIGNMNSLRDWGSAVEYMHAVSLISQLTEPTEIVLATGKQTKVSELVDHAFSFVGLKSKDFVRTNSELYRESDPTKLVGSAKKAENLLGWRAETNIIELIEDMIEKDSRDLS
jgi:GDPmannose 4,6-dehydratase